MKKLAAILLTILMGMSLGACGRENDPAEGEISGAENTEEADAFEDDPKPEDVEDNSTEDNAADAGEEQGLADAAEEVKILVAYFSATNTTEGVAKQIAESLSADLYEVIPEQPYTEEDLDYHENNSRSTIEMNDPDARPAISGSVENMEQYDIIFIGFPIWWGEAPRIVSTFVESYDFSGKIIVPFCTSGSSEVGSSASNLEALTTGAEWLSGTRLSGDSSYETIIEWINGLGLEITAQ